MICELRNCMDKWVSWIIDIPPTPKKETDFKEVVSSLFAFVMITFVGVPILLMEYVWKRISRLISRKKFYCSFDEKEEE